MDISGAYIKMCDCPQIQKEWVCSNGDFYYDVERREVRVAQFMYKMPCIGDIKLPRQDQLQEMLKSNYKDSASLLMGFVRWYKSTNDYKNYDGTINHKSMEQLLLSFVMHELYQIKWSGTEWIENKQ